MNIFAQRAEKILAHMFCFFFIAQILSPMIDGKSLYIDFILVMLNPFFLLWVCKYKFSLDYIYIVLFLGIIAFLGHPMTSIKLIVIFIEVVFLFYLYNRRLWYVNRYLFVSISIGMIQFYGLFFAPEISFMFSPENIASTIWGSYAMITNANFFSLFEEGLPHVSGFSREAGFMAGLILVGICVEYLFLKERYWNTSRISKSFYAIGYIICFTKISLLILPIYIIHRIRRVINIVPSFNMFVLWLLGMMVFWSFYQDFLLVPDNITFLHRFGAYASLYDMDMVQLLFGTESLGHIDSFIARTMVVDYTFFAGFGGWLITNGFLAGFAYYLILQRLRVVSTGILLLLLLIVNVQPDTNQNFVVLAYFVVFKYYRFAPNLRNRYCQKGINL